ncbi:MAG: hypothetical protein ACJ72K_02850 [Friedmanniella sp.]
MARSPRRTPAPRRPTSSPAPTPPGPAPTLGMEVADLLGAEEGVFRWAGRALPAMPADYDQLLAETEQVLARTGQVLDAATRSLQDCCGLGWLLLSNGPEDEAPVPDWLLDPDAPLDALDVIFVGASYPARFRSPVEFSHARDAWLEILAEGPNRHELAQTVAAAVDVCAELDLPVDSQGAWLALLLRMVQARIGTRPLAAAAMPRRALEGHRAVTGPKPWAGPSERAPDAAEALVASLPDPQPSVETPRDALRVGLTTLVAAVLDEVASLDELAVAGGPLDPGDPAVPGLGTPEQVQSADQAEARLNVTLAALEAPADRVAGHPPSDVGATVDALGPTGALAALRLGLVPEEPRGTAIRLAAPWAAGLASGSPLIPVTDALLDSARVGERGMAALSRVCALPQLQSPLRPAAGPFPGAGGTALLRIALDAGVDELSTSRTFQPKSAPPGSDETGETEGEPNLDEQATFSPEEYQDALELALSEAGISDLTVRACRIAGSEPPVRRHLEQDRQDVWEAAVAEAAVELGLDQAAIGELRAADDVRWRQMLTVSRLQQMGSDPEVAQQFVAALRDLVDDLEPGDLLELATETDAAALADDLRFNVSLRAYVVTQAHWAVDAAVRAAHRWADESLAAQVAEIGPAVESDTRAALEAATEPQGGPRPVMDVGWSAVPALAVLFAVALTGA